MRQRTWLRDEDATEIVAELAERGYSQEATATMISARYGTAVTRSAIGAYAARVGIQFYGTVRGRRWSRQRRERHRAAMRRSWSARHAAD